MTKVDEADVKREAIRDHAWNCWGAIAATATRLPGNPVPTPGHTWEAHLDDARRALEAGDA